MHLSFLLSALALLPRSFATSTLAYCSTENTGVSGGSSSSTYQSNGLCEGTCADYAFGILQQKLCWCSNIVPASGTRESTTKCDSGCPGYPEDSCGNSTMGVYAYVAISGNSATSTASGSSSSSTSTGTTSSSSSSSSTISTTDSSSSSSTTTTAPTVAYTTSSDGQVKTITVSASSSTSGADGSAVSTTSEKSSGLSGGSIAGIVVGVLGGLALVGALVFLVFFYRKRARSSSPVPSQDMADRTSQGSNWSRGVFPGGAGGSDLGRKATFTDNRMKTSTAIYPNGPRDSSVSLQDNEDYSRPVLRLTNPDEI
ncbi:Carbohydrate-binding WSC subgroup [Penicillium verhagenii]|uniref:Carbohydrate-binding WSC subgroup n=1 Tax=Penicillium verhagenii TaxID=1562060 RepID=UPI002544F28B|nr:Carbohydrate-binding WSC subgroup [Penicillium verhagenii]KAJ5947691.1 Carbohydrate-binding WSC subgroup [Penicillium verhagenii]